MAFNESAKFPTNISINSSGGPGFSTSIIEGEAGTSERVSRWTNAKRKYNAKYGIRTLDQLNQVIDLYVVSEGPVIGFRYKDWADFTTASNHRAAPTKDDVLLGVATGSSGSFQLRTKYVYGGVTKYRTITKPVAGTILVAKNGVNTTAFTADTTTGIISIASGMTPGDTISAGCEFDVPCQFGPEIDDLLAITISNYENGDLPDIPIEEMVGDVTSPERFYYGGGSHITAAADFYATFGLGRVIIFQPSSTATSYNCFLPDPSDLELGGYYFNIFNVNTGGGNLVLKTYDGSSTLVTLGSFKNALLCVYNDGTSNKWAAFSN